jgi:hypothetical protein
MCGIADLNGRVEIGSISMSVVIIKSQDSEGINVNLAN